MPTEDTIRQTNFLTDVLAPKQGEIILDIGCGTGNEIKRICDVAEVKKINGIDISGKALLKAGKKLSKEIKQGKVELLKAGASDKLPFPSEYFDAIFSAELVECLPKEKQDSFLEEMHRILKPGGRILTEHTDWDTQVWNASDKNLERKLVHAFCDTTQGWMESSEGWMGRKLWGFFNNSKLFKNCRMEVYVLTNTRYKTPLYGYQRSLDMNITTQNKNYKITKKDVEKFLADLEKQDKNGTYFYSVNRYIHIGYK